MRAVTLYYLVEPFLMLNYFYTIRGCNNVEHYNNSDNSTEINVTAWSNRNKTYSRIIDVNVTWSQALNICETMQFGSVDISLPNWVKRINVRIYLQGINYKNLDYKFWVRSFRPHLHVRQWYLDIKTCKQNPYLSNIGDHSEGRCAAIKRNESDFFKETLFVKNCNKRNPFVCTQQIGCIDLLAYTGFDVLETPFGATPSYHYNVTSDNCETKCTNDSDCNSFTYTNLSDSCTIFKKKYGYGALNYTIYKLNVSDVTHYVKTGSVIEFISNLSHISIPTDNLDLPDCGVAEIPPNFCAYQANTETNVATIDDIAKEIVKNLTIDKKETSAYRRKVSSSTDKRNVSKAFGSLGLIVIIATLSLFVISDAFSYVKKTTGKSKKRNTKSNNK